MISMPDSARLPRARRVLPFAEGGATDPSTCHGVRLVCFRALGCEWEKGNHGNPGLNSFPRAWLLARTSSLAPRPRPIAGSPRRSRIARRAANLRRLSHLSNLSRFRHLGRFGRLRRLHRLSRLSRLRRLSRLSRLSRLRCLRRLTSSRQAWRAASGLTSGGSLGVRLEQHLVRNGDRAWFRVGLGLGWGLELGLGFG